MTMVSLALLLTPLLLTPTTALHADEAGLTDFLLRTPGHGQTGVQYARPIHDEDLLLWVTSESGPGSILLGEKSDEGTSGCHVSARDVNNGNVIWRVDACSSPGGRYAALISEDDTANNDKMVHTLDEDGILRGWKVGGGLQWENDVVSKLGVDGYDAQPRLLSGGHVKQTMVGSVLTNDVNEMLMLHHSQTGEIVTNEAISAKQLLQDAKVKPASRAHVISLISSDNRLGVLTGYSNKNEVSLSSMAYTELEQYKPSTSVPLKLSGDAASAPIMASSLKVFALNDKMYIMGIDRSSKIVIANFDAKGKGSGKIVSLVSEMKKPTSIIIDGATTSAKVVRVAGLNENDHETESVFLAGEDADGAITFETMSSSNAKHQALVHCPDMDVTLAASTALDGTAVLSTSAGSSIEGDTALISPGSSGIFVENAHLIACKPDSISAAFTARGGMTIAVRLDKNGSSLVAKHLWSTEEALASISSAVFLDETHAISISSDGSVNADDEEKTALQKLQFSSRIQSQLSSLQNFLFGGGIFSSLASMALMSDEKKTERNFHFGFAKISVLLSESMHRIIALDTAKKGRVVWAMNLNSDATMHKIVHGGQSLSLNNPHGYGGVHDHELLVLSHVPSRSSIEWRCFDGMTGRVFSNDVVEVSSGVAQIVPLRSAVHHSSHDSASCRQVALLVHDDDTVTLIPDTKRSHDTVKEAVSTVGKSGLFVHTIDKTSGEFRAMRVAEKSGASGFELATVGTALFDPLHEKIVNVAYPQRGEVIQSPSTVLGDDALLLKYLNPHLVVVVTESTKTFLAEATFEDGDDNVESSFYKALASSDGSSGQKRKPLGASKPGEAPPAATNALTPSLFVTLIDSVSGQILHRASHAHAAEEDISDDAPANVPVVVSENWVVYSFFNQRTRRTDVGVLTLHEGMIDKNGLTAFNGPEQELIFSSLESVKPIVLSKTFGLAKAITALGVTVTKAGISSKQFLFATGNDQVISMDRRLMDPRRPSGELKLSEKMEGLTKYAFENHFHFVYHLLHNISLTVSLFYINLF